MRASDPPPEITSDPSTWLDWMLDVPLQIAIVVAIALVVLWLLRRSIRHVAERIAAGTTKRAAKALGDSAEAQALQRANPLAIARRAQRARTIGSVLRSTADIVVGVVAALLVLDILGVNIAPFIASAGVVGVAVGFGAQSLVKDFLSGTFMLLEDQYGVGDTVDLIGVSGTVEEIALRLTKVRAADGTLWYVRNGEVLRAGNKTQEWSRAVVPVLVPITADPDVVRAALGRAVDRVRRDPVLSYYLLDEPEVRGIEDMTDTTLTFSLRVRTRAAVQWEVERNLREAARAELLAARVVGVVDDPEGADDTLVHAAAEDGAEDGSAPQDAPADPEAARADGARDGLGRRR